MKNKLFLLLALFFLSFSNASAQVEDGQGTGLNFNDEQYSNDLTKAPLTRSLYGSSLPKSASLKKYAPTPKSQGNYGTCVGWSSAFCGYTIVNSVQNNWTDKTTIDANTFSPGFIYSQIKLSSDNTCRIGSSISDALELMKTKGVPKYTDMEMSCPNSVPLDVFNKASNYKIQDFAKLFGIYDSESFKLNAIKKSLSENKPIIIGMKAPNSFNNAKNYWIPTENPEGNYGGHAMCVIGYDDDKFGGAFEVQNSWGDSWGNQGYIWIKYQDFFNWVKYAYEMIYIPKKTITNEKDLAGKIKLVESDGNTMSAYFNGNYYQTKNSYKSGTKFRIYISNNEPAFVYAFGSDETKKVFPVFPHQPNISPALNYKQNDVAIPDEEHYIEMDNTVGTDYLCVLYSLNPIKIEEIHKKIENYTGSFEAKVKYALENKLVEQSNVNFNNNEVSFTATSKGKSIVAIIIATNHVK
ncbi:MAG: DUF4384 domain-containing protein [Bacteroidales bacterium]|nr:DUF4384 domain-containing protein [Bacteroidales bacterium]MBN2757572.1 DUF4384 domain-containing protein [Bacteroidales bacterium]